MYVSISQEVSRQHRQEIMHEVRAVRRTGANRDGESSLVRDLGWELSRYAGLLGKRFRK